MNVNLYLAHLEKAAALSRGGKVRVTVESIPNSGQAALEAPDKILDQEIAIKNNALQLMLADVSPQSALVVRLAVPAR